MAVKFGARPFQLLATPICFLVACYASFVYGIVYLMLAAIPIQFGEERGWGPVVSETPFLGILLGALLGGAANILNNTFYTRRFKANGNKAVPEARLPPMMVGSVFFAAGMFIFGWCSDPSIFWLAPVFGTVCLGFGFFTIFQVRHFVHEVRICVKTNLYHRRPSITSLIHFKSMQPLRLRPTPFFGVLSQQRFHYLHRMYLVAPFLP